MLAEHWNDVQSPPPPIPPLLTRWRDPSPRTALVLGKEILLGHEVWGLPRSIFLWKKRRTANNQTHLSNKNRMGHQAGISTLNQGKPAGLLTGPEDLGWGMGKADRRPLRKQECGSCQWRISENVKGSWPGTWKSCGYGGPRSLRRKREGSGLVQETTTTKQAGATVGVVRSNKKRQMTPCENHYAFELFFKVGNATKFSGKTVSRDLFCLEVGEKRYPQSNRKDPLPTQQTDSTTEENFLFQISASQRMKKQRSLEQNHSCLFGCNSFGIK